MMERMRAGWGHRSIQFFMLLYLLLPLVATALYAFAKDWQTTILPKVWTLDWFSSMFQDARFFDALWTSFYLCGISVAFSLLVMVPAVFVITLYYPRWEAMMKVLVVLPYAVPGVVAAVGLIRAYSSGPIQIAGTSYILIGAYFVVIMPYMYQGIRNSLLTVSAPELMQAAGLLGATPMRAFRTVVLPNILPGVIVSALLSFSVLFGEFVLTNMLVGSHIQTIQIYLYARIKESGHLSSAIAVTYFAFFFILSTVVMRLGQRLSGGMKR